MYKAHIAFGIDHAIQWHSSELKKIHFLLIHSGNRMPGIGQADKWDLFILPILLEYIRCIRAHCQDNRVAVCEFFVLITQARQLRTAIGSHKTAQEGQHHGPPAKIG
jgi:hypothetical protein